MSSTLTILWFKKGDIVTCTDPKSFYSTIRGKVVRVYKNGKVHVDFKESRGSKPRIHTFWSRDLREVTKEELIQAKLSGDDVIGPGDDLQSRLVSIMNCWPSCKLDHTG